MTLTLKLEVGKKYVDDEGSIATIVYANKKRFVGEFEGGNLFSFYEDGSSAIGIGNTDLVKEYITEHEVEKPQ